MNDDDLLGVPETPPKEWFTEIPSWLFGGDAHTHFNLITDPDHPDFGRFAGVVYDERYCYANITDECWSPPASQVNGAGFNTTPVTVADGSKIYAGEPVVLGGHPVGIENMTQEEARDFHEDTQSQWVYATYYDILEQPEGWPEPVRMGILLGGAKPSITVGQAAQVTGPASGEWWPDRYRHPDTGATVESLELQAIVRVGTPALAVGLHERAASIAKQSNLALAASLTAPATDSGRPGWVKYGSGVMVGPFAEPTPGATLVASVRAPVDIVDADCDCQTPDLEHIEPPNDETKEPVMADTEVTNEDAPSLNTIVAGLTADELTELRELLAGPVTDEEKMRDIARSVLAETQATDAVAAANDVDVDGDGIADAPVDAGTEPEVEATLAELSTRLSAVEDAVMRLVQQAEESEMGEGEAAVEAKVEAAALSVVQ